MALPGSRPNNRIVLFIGIICAVVAFGGVLFLLKGTNQSTTTVLAFKTDVTANTTLTSDMVTTEDIPTATAPRDAVTDSTLVVGKQVVGNVTANTVVVGALLTTPGSVTASQGAQGALSISAGYVAMAIPTSVTIPAASATNPYSMIGGAGDLMSVGFYVRPEDHIDILIANPTLGGANSTGGTNIVYAFQDLRVLKVGDNTGAGAASAASGSVFVVEVPRAQAELLTQLFMVTCNGATTPPTVEQSCASSLAVKYVLRAKCESGDLNYPADVKAITGIGLDNYTKGLDADGKTPLTPAQKATDAAKLVKQCINPYPNYVPISTFTHQPDAANVPSAPPTGTVGPDPGATVGSLQGLFH